MTKPLKALCLDPKWRYYPASDTNVARTFARVRRQMKEEAEAAASVNVRPLKKEAKK